jgi:hypothetical protein
VRCYALDEHIPRYNGIYFIQKALSPGEFGVLYNPRFCKAALIHLDDLSIEKKNALILLVCI